MMTNQMEDFPCIWCSSGWNKIFHTGVCPKIKTIEYNKNGTIKRVEFHITYIEAIQ